jgi:nucleoside 2-deoxyribosyltransferase
MAAKTRVYVAGSIREPMHVKIIQTQIEKWGFEISHDWTKHLTARNLEEMIEQGRMDLAGIDNAQILIAVFTDLDGNYRGTCTEIGYALARKRFIIMLDLAPQGKKKGFRTNPFLYQPQVHEARDIDDLKEILEVWDV